MSPTKQLAPYRHTDGSNCWTKNCSLDHMGASNSFIKANDVSGFLSARELEQKPTENPFLPKQKDIHALEYGSDDYKLFINRSEELELQVSAEEYKTVSEYTGWAFKEYYGFLEGKNRDGSAFGAQYEGETKEALLKKLATGVNHLDNLVAKAGMLPKPVQVFRGEKPPKGMSAAEHLKSAYPVGGTITVSRFLSTSMDAKVASEITSSSDNSYVLAIRTREGAMLSGNISEHGLREKEVLLPRNRSYRVESISEAVIHWGGTKKVHTVVNLILE